MTRIIAGTLGSLRLKGAAKSTRPTSDRVKESIFAKLEAEGLIEGARVLDLFAGTGALAIEAISRGANSALVIENNKSAFEILRTNVELAKKGLGAQDLKANLEHKFQSAEQFLRATSEQFDLVFIDPPYEVSDEQIRDLLGQVSRNLAEASALVLERSNRSQLLIPEDLVIDWHKTYGDTQVAFLGRS